MRVSYVECSIANGASLATQEMNVRDWDIVAVEMPAAWTAAAISFQGTVRNDGAGPGAGLTETFQDVFDSAGAEVSLTVTAGKYVALTPAHIAALRGLARVKVRSGLTGAAVNQGAARTLRFVLAAPD